MQQAGKAIKQEALINLTDLFKMISIDKILIEANREGVNVYKKLNQKI